MLDADIKAKKGRDVTGSWDKASLHALWTRVSSETGLIRDVVVASTVSVCVFWTRISDLCFMDIFRWTAGLRRRRISHFSLIFRGLIVWTCVCL
jgi:hypothetical protein